MSRSSYPSWKTNKLVSRFFQYLILSIIVVLMFVPVVMLVFGALKTRGELITHPYTVPIPPTPATASMRQRSANKVPMDIVDDSVSAGMSYRAAASEVAP